MLDNMPTHDVAQRIGIPAPAAKQYLLTPWTIVTGRLRSHPARLARLVAQQGVEKPTGRSRYAFLCEQRPYSALDIAKRRGGAPQRILH